MRTASFDRKTRETKIKLDLSLDGAGEGKINTPLKFMNHMLECFAKHSKFDLVIEASGDVEVEDHHLVEDLGITLGLALDKALGEKKGINNWRGSCNPVICWYKLVKYSCATC